MTRRKKLLLVLLSLILLSQIPFAYRRYKLGKLHAAIQQVNAQRHVSLNNAPFVEYKGVVHVHSFLGGHSRGGFEEIISAAKSNQLNFVVMTEHTSENFNTAAMTLKGMQAGILFVNGNEVSTVNSDRLLIFPGNETTDSVTRLSTSELIAKEKARGARAFVAYPQEFKGWEADGYDGIEVYNVFTNARQVNPFIMFFDGLWSYRSYPDLLFASFYSRPAQNLDKWDELTAKGRRLAAIAGNDAHANVGFSLNDASGNTLLGLQLDPYERSFRLMRVHVLISRDKPLTSETLLEALANGHSFIGFDLFGDSSGFTFLATNGAENKGQGDEIALKKEVRLTVNSPVPSRIVLFKDGQAIRDERGLAMKEYVVAEKGIYRVEVYLPQLPGATGGEPWIISNPIYVR